MPGLLATLLAVLLAPVSGPRVPTSTPEPTAWAEADRLATEGRHPEAAAAYARAWDEEGAVAILYSWAQSERLAGDCERALDLYARFLEAGEAAPPEYEGEVMRARWSDMRANAERQRDACAEAIHAAAAAPEPPPPVVKDELPAPATPSEGSVTDRGATERDTTPRAPWWRDPVGWTLTGVGAASLVAGGTLVGVAAWRDDRAESRGTHQAFDDAIDRAMLEQRIGIGLLAAGGAFAIAGAVRLGIVARKRRGAGRVAVAPAVAAVAVIGRF